MARLFNDGAEMGDVIFWDAYSSGVSADAVVKFGDYSYLLSGAGKYVTKIVPSAAEYYLRDRIYITNNNVASGYPQFRNSNTNLCGLAIDAIGRFVVQVGGSTVLTSALVYVPSQWYEVEIHVKIDDAPNGIFKVYIDGNLVLDFTGDTKPGAATQIDNIYYYIGAGTLNLDDFAINDTTGGSDNSWVGAGSYVKVYPNGDGAHNDWTGQDGDKVNNWQNVDEFPKDDDTTYNYHDGSISGHQDQYALSHLSFTGKTITRIFAEARCRKTASSAHTVKLGFLASGGADVVSAGRTLFTNAYIKVVGDDTIVNPVDGNPWEEADIDALEFVIETG